MPITESYMDGGPWGINLSDETPRWVLDDIDVRQKLWATIVVTPQHIDPADISASDLMALARYSGVYLGMGAGRTSLYGEGLSWWLGEDGDGGDLHASVDINYTDEFLVDILTNLVFNGANGLTLSYTGSIAEKFEIDLEGGDTKREVLDTILAQCSSDVAWRITPAGVVKVDAPTSLFPTRTTPTVILTEQGGRDGNITGLPAEMDLDELNGAEVRDDVWVDWDDGHNSGRAYFSPSWYDFVGQSPEVRFLMDWRPKRARPPTEKWRKLAAWQVQSETKANRLAARELNERTEVRSQFVVNVPVYDPHRYDITPGNSANVWDLDSATRDLTNEVYYQGEVIHPLRSPVQQMTWPILEGYGVYLRYFTSIGGTAQFYDLTQYVEPDGGATKLVLGHRERLAPAMAARKMSKLKKKRIRQAARYAAGKLRTTAADNRNPDHLRVPPSLNGPGFNRLPPPVRPTR